MEKIKSKQTNERSQEDVIGKKIKVRHAKEMNDAGKE